ncbi:nuclear pore complex protein Nup160-like [Menidia menidia]
MYRSELVPEQSLQSVFTDVGRLGLEDPAHSAPLPPSAGLTVGPGATAAWLSPQGHAHFAVASPAGGVVLLTLPPQDAKGELLVVELRRSSVMRKLSGWLPSMRGDHPPGGPGAESGCEGAGGRRLPVRAVRRPPSAHVVAEGEGVAMTTPP